MVVFLEDRAVDVEDLPLDEALTVLRQAEAELPAAVNSAHAEWLRAVIGEVGDQIEWLLPEQRQKTA